MIDIDRLELACIRGGDGNCGVGAILGGVVGYWIGGKLRVQPHNRPAARFFSTVGGVLIGGSGCGDQPHN